MSVAVNALAAHSMGIGLDAWSTVAAVGLNASYDDILSGLLQTLIFLANVAGGLVVGVATVRGLVTYIGELIHSRGGDIPKEAIRLSLGRSLALALEFQVGADILGTALHPTQRDVTVLAAIVILRTALNFFLQRELDQAQKREAAANSPSPTRDHTNVEGLSSDMERERVPAPQTTSGELSRRSAQ
jgi:uncharacterized membrane protein